MNILAPIKITAAMIGAGTSVAEPSARETAEGITAWANTTYALGDRRISDHRVFECVAAIASPTGKTPENDATHWLDAGPSDRWAPFDYYTTTQALDVTSMTYVLSPGYFNGLSLYGLAGTAIVVSVKDAPGGSQIYRYPLVGTASLNEPPMGWYDYLFGKRRTRSKLVLTGIPIRSTAEITVTVTNASGQPVGIGMINAGDFRPLIGDADWGGTLSGVTAEPITYSYMQTDEYGKTKIVQRHSATNLRLKVAMPRANADAALASVQEVLDVPVSWVATEAQGFDGLNAFGLGSASANYTFGIAEFDINVKGLI